MPNLLLICGAPSSGKTFLADMIDPDNICPDQFWLIEDRWSRESEKHGWIQAERVVNYRKLKKRDIVFSAVMYKREHRERVMLWVPNSYDVACIHVNTDLDVCLKRNSKRYRIVPGGKLRYIHDHFEPVDEIRNTVRIKF